MKSSRNWGDGVGDSRPHVIGDISFSADTPYAYCVVDGELVVVGDQLTLEDAWDMHRGLAVGQRAVRRAYGPQADDAEVREFLHRVEDPSYTPRVYQSEMAGSYSAHTAPDLTDAFELMERLMMERGNG